MKILDFYIIKKFFSAYIFIILIFSGILIVIDLAEKIENFRKPTLTAWRIFSEYYIFFVPHFTSQLSPLIVFITAVFVTSRLSSHTEIIAMLSSGMSFRRILRPFFIASVLIGMLVFYLYGYLVPETNKKRHAFENEFVREKYFYKETNTHKQLAPNIYAYLQNYDNNSKTGYRFTLEKIKNKELLIKLEAAKIVWNEKKKKWILEDYRLRTFDKDIEKISFGKTMDTTLAMQPTDFESKHLQEEQLTITELNNIVKDMKLRGEMNVETFIVEVYMRYAYPFSIIILTLIGVIVSARKVRGGTGKQIAIGFGLAIIYVFLIIIFKNFAQKEGFPPILAVWLPNILFALIGFYLYFKLPK
jgi:lipopolysaccharide export system permease protein